MREMNGTLPAGWEVRRLGEVCEIDKTQGIHTGLPYVGLEDIESHTGRFIGSSDLRKVKSSTFRFNPEHVLYGRLRPYLRKVLAPDFSGHCSTEIFPIRPSRHLSRSFLLYWLLCDTTVWRINTTCTGARMPRANMDAVLQFELPLPPLPEQKRIVAILDDAFQGIDAAIANTEKNLASSDQLYSIYLDTVLKQKGAGWMESRLGDVVSIRHGFAFRSEYFVGDGEYVLLTPGNFFEGGGYRDRGEKQKYYDGDIPDGYVLSEGALLVAMTEQAAGLLGSPLLVPESGRFLHNQRLGLVVPRNGIPVSNEFFFHAFNAPAFRREIHATASGVKVRHTSPAKLGDAVISFPTTLEAQQEVAMRLSEVRQHATDLRASYERKLRSLAELKQSILQKAFSGGLAA